MYSHKDVTDRMQSAGPCTTCFNDAMMNVQRTDTPEEVSGLFLGSECEEASKPFGSNIVGFQDEVATGHQCSLVRHNKNSGTDVIVYRVPRLMCDKKEIEKNYKKRHVCRACLAQYTCSCWCCC